MRAPEPCEPLSSFQERSATLCDEGCAAIAEQAARLLEDAWVHLPAAQARGADPVGALRRLGARLPATRGAFQRALLRIFAALGDGHTQCHLPAPFAGRLAFLPLLVREARDRGQRQIVVAGSAIEGLARGDILCSWNGTPVSDVVRRHMALQWGGNLEVRRARAVQTLCVRPLDWLPLPEDRDVVLESMDPGQRRRSVHLSWQVADRRWVGQRLAPCLERTDGDAPAHSLRARVVETSSGTFGCIRISSLQREPDALMAAFLHVLADMPRSGLVLDLRGCEEGIIPAGEQLLQLFTADPIEPQPFQFRITALIRHLLATRCGTSPALAPWHEAVEEAARRGDAFSRCRPLTSRAQANRVGRRYHGPVVVLTDALTYSTAEMLAAGIQDHGIGVVVGTAGRTGGGGGSPWSQELIHRLSGQERFRPVPRGPRFRVAVRRCRRVRAHQGLLLEGLGVVPDVVHWPTRADVLHDDVDLMDHIGRIFRDCRIWRLWASNMSRT